MMSKNTKHYILAWIPCWVNGIWISFLLPINLAIYCIMAIFGLVILAIWKRWHWCLTIAIICFGIWFGLWRTQTILNNQLALSLTRTVQIVQLIVIDIPHTDKRRTRFLAQVQMPDRAKQIWLLSDYQRRQWLPGSQWVVEVRVRPAIGMVNQVGFNQEAWALSNHIVALGTIKGQRKKLDSIESWRGYFTGLRMSLGQSWQQQSSAYPQGVPLLQALTVGDQAALPDNAWQIFRPLGINHLVSISGLHVGMLAMLAAWLCNKLLRLLPFQINQPWRYVRLTAVVVAIIYSGLAGFAVPTQRSMLMIIALALTWRRGHLRPLQVWWLVMSIVLLYDPLATLSVGFWLSFLLVAALMWAGEGFLYLSRIMQIIQAQWAAGIASIILVAYIFGSVPLLSPFVNVLAIPFFTLILVPIALLSVCIPFQPILQFAAWLSEQTMLILNQIAEYAPEYYPAHAPIILWLLGSIAVLIILLPKGFYLRPWALLIMTVLLTYRPDKPKSGQVLIKIWDIGQGLAVSFNTTNHAMLFDTGTAYATQSILIPNMQAAGIKRLDKLVLSHNDEDHDGGAELIRQQFKPREIWAGQSQAYSYAVQKCQAGKNWQWDGVWFEFLNLPVLEKAKKNEHSCVLRAIAADKAILITGDLSKKNERVLVATYGEKLFSQILVLGHHGSHSSSDLSFLRAVSPEFGVASSGFANHYGHPHSKVLNLLKQEEIKILRTDHMGGLYVLLSEQPIRWYSLKFYKPYWQRKPFQNP